MVDHDRSGKMSRRHLLSVIGLAGLGLTVPTLIGMENPSEASPTTQLESPEMGIISSIGELRAVSASPPECRLYFLSEQGKEGFFLLDETDTTSPDNTGTVIVTAAGNRYKRLIEGSSVNIKWFGAVGDMRTDDTTAIQTAIDSGASTIVVPTGNYSITSMLVLPSKVIMIGGGMLSRIVKRHDGFMIHMSDQSQLQDIHLVGNGDRFNGGGVWIDSGGNQKMLNCSITDTNDYCIEYGSPWAGAISTIDKCLLYTADKTKKPAVKYPEDEANGDRKLISVDCNGGLLADFAGCSTVLVTNCNTVGVLFRDQSKKVSLIGNRIAGGTLGISVEVFGTNHLILGNISATPIYIGAGTNHSVIMGNIAELYDRSGSGTNHVDSKLSGISVASHYGQTDNMAANLLLGGGGKSPNAGSIAFGDGSGWKLNMGTNKQGAFAPLFSFFDTGSFVMEPADSRKAANGSLFVDSSDKKLKFKDSGGTIRNLY